MISFACFAFLRAALIFGRKHGVKGYLRDAAASPSKFKLQNDSGFVRADPSVPVEYKIGGFLNWEMANDFCKNREGLCRCMLHVFHVKPSAKCRFLYPHMKAGFATRKNFAQMDR
jgi:hypothetical protein